MCRSNTDTLCSVKLIAERFTGLPDKVGRYQIIKSLKSVGDRLGFNKNHITYLELMVSYTKEADWHGGDSYPMVWLSVQEIAYKLNISRRQVNRIERSLVTLRAIYIEDYGNFRRFGWRDEGGSVKTAFGVDLRPLGLLWDELSALQKIAKQEDAKWKETRYAVSSLRRRVGDILRSGNVAVSSLIRDIVEDEVYSCRIGRATPLEELMTIRNKLQNYLEKLEQAIVDNLVFEQPLHSKMSHKCDVNVSHHIIPTNIPKVVSDVGSGTAEQLSESEPPIKGGGSVSLAYNKRQGKKGGKKRGRGSPPPLREIIDAVSPRLREQLVDHNNPSLEQVTNPSTDDLIDACRRLAPKLGVSSSLWRETVGQLNPYGASLALLVIDARHHVGEIYSPGGCLRGMLEKDKEGNLNINASLHGLVDRTMKEGLM